MLGSGRVTAQVTEGFFHIVSTQDNTYYLCPAQDPDEAVRRGYPVALVADNGFPDRYHPSAAQLDLCAAGRLLLVTPWSYRYRGRQEAITVPECKTMNCIAQSLCHKKDSWWKTPVNTQRMIK